MLRVYSTLTRTKEPFEPVRPGKVGIYLCGPTVYKPSHIGHMVGPVIFDAIKRYLALLRLRGDAGGERHRRGRQADRRVERRAACPMAQLAAEMTDDYMKNLDALGVDVIDHFPRCTETMGEIIEFTKTLVEKGFAYEAQGDVYFEVAKCPDYGKLSHRGVEAMRGEGGGMAERKRGQRRLRPLEIGQARRALLAQPLGTGPARLAHRVLRHEPQAAGRVVRHPRRRAGPDLPAPRKRNRPERVLPRQSRWPSIGSTTG